MPQFDISHKILKTLLYNQFFLSEKRSHNKPKKRPKTLNKDDWDSVELGANRHLESAVRQLGSAD